MDYEMISGNPASVKTGCAVIGVFEDKRLTEQGLRMDKAAKGHLSALIQSGELKGQVGHTLLLFRVPGITAERVLLVGLGKGEELPVPQYLRVLQAAYRRLRESAATDAVSFLADCPVKGQGLPWKLRQNAEAMESARYRFVKFKGKKKEKDEQPPVALTRLAFHTPEGGDGKAFAHALAVGRAIGRGMALTRDLGNTPANVCTPGFLAEQAEALGRAHKALHAKVLGLTEIEKLGMGSFLSVARGSTTPPCFIVMEYKGAKAAKGHETQGAAKDAGPVVLIGKGVTFDTGGISIKPAANMDEMKYDMCGAASVLGVMQAALELKLPLHLVGLIPATENMPSGSATKPGDIVTSMSGQTIEILNTDAEGRLILCDAMTYAEQFKPRLVIDIATLTGACVVALGHVASGLLSNREDLAADLLAAGMTAGDPAWQLPLWEEYQSLLDSNFADFANIGGRDGGTITAACFLSRFARKYAWAHLDIAGTAWRTGKQKGATGRPVPLLVQFLLNQVGRSG